jgi:hypothetical protein
VRAFRIKGANPPFGGEGAGAYAKVCHRLAILHRPGLDHHLVRDTFP